jgi:transposase
MTTGIDCSKDFLDLANIEDCQKVSFTGKFSNDKEGFEKLLKHVEKSALIVMEATGPYYMQLAIFLKGKGLLVAVVNPLVIRRFCQMRMSRAKTDKKDAILIAQYGLLEKPAEWKAPSELVIQIQQTETYVEGLKKRKQIANNQLHAFKHTGQLSKPLEKEIEEEIEGYNKKIAEKEKEILGLLEKEHGKLLKNLKSIPGIGDRSAILLILTTNGFNNFASYKQLISYFGLAPRIYESGSSVRGKARICKMGMSQVRKTLYMAAKSAILYNKTCKELYDRLRAKGKAYRVALIAVVNKLIKQAFAIAKSETAYTV